MSISDIVTVYVAYGKARAEVIRKDERGEVTEKVLITSMFAALAIAAGAVIVTKVMAKANSIPTK